MWTKTKNLFLWSGKHWIATALILTLVFFFIVAILNVMEKTTEITGSAKQPTDLGWWPLVALSALILAVFLYSIRKNKTAKWITAVVVIVGAISFGVWWYVEHYSAPSQTNSQMVTQYVPNNSPKVPIYGTATAEKWSQEVDLTKMRGVAEWGSKSRMKVLVRTLVRVGHDEVEDGQVFEMDYDPKHSKNLNLSPNEGIAGLKFRSYSGTVDYVVTTK